MTIRASPYEYNDGIRYVSVDANKYIHPDDVAEYTALRQAGQPTYVLPGAKPSVAAATATLGGVSFVPGPSQYQGLTPTQVAKSWAAPVQAVQQAAATPADQQVLSQFQTGPNQYDLIKMAQTAINDPAIKAVMQQSFSPSDVQYAEYAAKPPLEVSQWEKLSPERQKELRPVRDVTADEYARMSNWEKLGVRNILKKEVSAEVYAKLGKGSKEMAIVKRNFWQSLYNTDAPLGSPEAWKRAGIWGAEAIVPGVYVSRHWKEMPTYEKGLYIFIDSLILLPVVAQAKLLPEAKQIWKARKEAQPVLRAAVEAGQERKNLRIIREEVLKFQKGKQIFPENDYQARMLSAMDEAANKSMRADIKLADKIESLSRVNSRTLAKIEKQSGFIGLQDSIKDITASQKRIKQLWGDINKYPKESLARGAVYNDLQAEYSKLDKMYESYRETIRPTQTHGQPSRLPQMGQQVEWGKYIAKKGKLGKNPNYGVYKEAIAKAEKETAAQRAKRLLDEQRFKEVSERIDEIRIREERPWESKGGGTKTATEVQQKLGLEKEQELDELLKKKAKSEPSALEEASRSKAPEVQESKFGMKAKPKFKPSIRAIPQEVSGRRTLAQIAQEYGNQAVEDAIGKPINQINTKGDLRTAQEVNQQYQNALQGSLQTAVNTFTSVYGKTGDEVKAWARTEARVQTQLATKTQLKTGVKTAVKDAVRDIFRERVFTPKPKPILGGTDLEIKEVRGVPPNPGVISWDAGVVKVLVKPPYREGTEDIDYDRLKVARKGKGTQESTLKVTGGKAPQLIVLGRGIDRISVIKGKRMSHSRQRGPGIIDRQGRIHRQKRGSVI